MTEQKNAPPQPLSDEELEAATGGAVGINPFLLYAAGAQGMYTPTAEPLPAPVAPGFNPLYVAPAEPYVPPTVPQASAPAPQPASTPAPAPEPAVIPMTNDVFGGGSMNIGSPISTKITITGTATLSGGTTPEPMPDFKPEVLILGTQPTYTTVTATVNGVRDAGMSDAQKAIDGAFVNGGAVRPLRSGS